MKQTSDLIELMTISRQMQQRGLSGQTYVNQAKNSTEAPLLSDEDTVGRQALQVLRVLVDAGDEKVYFNFLFTETFELEEVMVQLEEVFKTYPKVIVSDEEMDAFLA